jgi:1-deoxy-D-xylulose-5-phosphate synthase
MSISPPVGAMNNYFTRVISSKLYSTVREESKKVLSRMPTVWDLARKTEEHVKGMIVPGTLFEELGFNYIGPIDGHDVDMLVDTISNIKDLSGPVFLHVVTKKGKGYPPAEKDPLAYHGVPAFDPMADCLPKSTPSKSPTYTQVFGRWL